MNRQVKKATYLLPKTIDSFQKCDDYYLAEYDGWHFEGQTMKSVTNQILKYIFKGGEE